MPKSQTTPKKKRKREDSCRSFKEERIGDGGYEMQPAERRREEIVFNDEGTSACKSDHSTKQKDKKKKKKKKSGRIRSENKTYPRDDIHKNEENSVEMRLSKKSKCAVRRKNEHLLESSTREKQCLPKKKEGKNRVEERKSSYGCNKYHPEKSNIDIESKQDFYNEKIADENNDDGVVLEGSMISGILVLIDREAGRVYSATEERLQNGDRKQVGRIDRSGRILLFPKVEKHDLLFPSNSENICDGENPSSIFPYEVDPDDHCESPLEAYEDIVALLKSYGRRTGKQSSSQLSIYDPYFCNGRVARHLESLGFPKVYNRKEDCYKVWKNPSIYPTYDIFLTNPPYSADHIEKLMQHVTSDRNENRPWMLLMPNFVHKKDYFQKLTTDRGQLPIYLVPRKRYIYQPPPNMRSKKASSTHKKSSPFVSMWYLWGGSREVTDEWYQLLRMQRSTKFDLARSKSALRDLRRKQKRK